ncbi:MAG: sigma-70 family RNA polymerase sigma factor [Candidatus Hydrogenedentes bacterium]|nr:sigma-70 family RNA polymerase sigma factor [Candidatus Hydrogenedentota bacterium]
MSTESRTDEMLVAELCQGRKEALGELAERYQTDLFRFCLHYVRDVERAKELTQETFIRVYVARDRFDETRKFKPWVLCIARNLCLNDIKRKKTVQMDSLEDYASSARELSGGVLQSPSDSPDQLLMTDERHAMLDGLLKSLDDESREIVRLRYFEKMQARDIAEVVGSTEGAVRTRLHRILKGLRERYTGIMENY